ncbi:hypothetical protein SteCoe_11306 [Stentor coeruleus]|uniref:Uncharacterized protein n=1 Tax=Stentor coeruleus TaxID=5963 RepID=A0A1R2CDI6_9CILI|nr:hypothetical protein SteCoe_11306 [Stentor coeruleus]
MANSSDADKQKFLHFLGSPYKSMCNLFTLKSGLILITAFDIMIGITYFVLAIQKAIGFFIYGWTHFYYYIQFFRFIIHIIAIPFSILAMKACWTLNHKSIGLYSNYKIIEFILLIFSSALINLSAEIQEGEIHFMYFSIIGMIILRIVSLFIIKIIWSAETRLKYGETTLFMYGEEALKYIQHPVCLQNLSGNSGYDILEI